MANSYLYKKCLKYIFFIIKFLKLIFRIPVVKHTKIVCDDEENEKSFRRCSGIQTL